MHFLGRYGPRRAPSVGSLRPIFVNVKHPSASSHRARMPTSTKQRPRIPPYWHHLQCIDFPLHTILSTILKTIPKTFVLRDQNPAPVLCQSDNSFMNEPSTCRICQLERGPHRQRVGPEAKELLPPFPDPRSSKPHSTYTIYIQHAVRMLQWRKP